MCSDYGCSSLCMLVNTAYRLDGNGLWFVLLGFSPLKMHTISDLDLSGRKSLK